MKLLATSFLAMALLATPGAFADGHKGCACSKKCAEACNSGKGKDCKCKTCDCSKEGGCGASGEACKADEKKK